MNYKLGCPNCGNQIEVTMSETDAMVPCDQCQREYRVPPLPAPEVLQRRVRSSRQRQARFNLVVSAVAMLTVVLSVGGMLWLRTSNPVHGNTSTEVGVDESATPQPVHWNEDNPVADFAPVEVKHLNPFVGEFDLVGELTDDQKHVFGAPGSPSYPSHLKIDRRNFGLETLVLSFRGAEDERAWHENLTPTSKRLGHGFQPVAAFEATLSRLGAYSLDDFKQRGVAYSVNSHRFLNDQIVVTHVCLDKDEFSKDKPLRSRNHLCRVVSTYKMDADILTITKRATGPDPELTRRFVSLLNCDSINSRELVVKGLSEFENAWLAGQTIRFHRKTDSKTSDGLSI